MALDKIDFSLAAKARASIERAAEERMKPGAMMLKDDSNTASIEGEPYSIEARGESILVSLDLFRSGYECKKCKGRGKIAIQKFESGLGMVAHEEQCTECKGKGALLHIADTSKSLPTTGVVVSIGAKAKVDAPDIKLYDRVLFGPHSGQFIPIASNKNILFKMMHYREATGFIRGGEDLSSFDLVAYDKPVGTGE